MRRLARIFQFGLAFGRHLQPDCVDAVQTHFETHLRRTRLQLRLAEMAGRLRQAGKHLSEEFRGGSGCVPIRVSYPTSELCGSRVYGK
jgi:hypothetical protein